MKEEKKTLKFVVCDECGVAIGDGLCSYNCKYDGLNEYKRPLREDTYQLVSSRKIKKQRPSPQTP